MRIGLDAVPLIYSRGADYRTTLSLYRELLCIGGHDYRMLCVSRSPCYHALEPLRKAGAFSVRQVRSPFRLVNWSWKLLGRPVLESLLGDIDIYHGTSIYAPPARHARVLVTFRGIVAEVIPEKLPPERVQALKKVLRDALLRADHFIAVSETTAKDMARYLRVDPAKIHVIPHGVDPIFHMEEDREALQRRLHERFSLDAPYLLYVGAMGIHKNVLGLINAYIRLRQGGLGEHHLCLVGMPDSAWGEMQRMISEHHLAPYVHQIKWVAPHSDDLVDLYNGAVCCAFPSFYEGWCSPPIEAMACGSPVVVSNASSLPETTGGAALLVDPDDPASIAEGIACVLDERTLREELIAKGREHAARMNWKRSAGIAMQVYETVGAEV